MVPTLGVGDFILVGQINDFDEVVAAPKPDGDILVFLRSSSLDEYIVHRAVKKFPKNGEWRFVTKGDHNAGEDGQPVLEENVIGKVVGRVPIMGYFPLFIKTSRGFTFVAALMALVFFADYIMPDKRSEKTGGRFPWVSLIPFFVSPLVYLAFWFMPDSHLELELFALAMWYLGCLVAPTAYEDDDMGLMFWLYHFVLVMIPLGCDIVQWTTGVTPSRWWDVKGSSVPIALLFQKERPVLYQAFSEFALYLLPGCALYFVLTATKRRGVKEIVSLSMWMRRVQSREGQAEGVR